MTLLDRIDDTLAAHDATHAEATGHPWPGRVPSLDEMLEELFGPENGAPVPVRLSSDRWSWGEDIEPRVAPTWQSRESGMDVSFVQVGLRNLRQRRTDPWLAREAGWLAERAEREGGTPGPLGPSLEPIGASVTGGYLVPGSLVFDWRPDAVADEFVADITSRLATLPTVEFTITGTFDLAPNPSDQFGIWNVWIDEWVNVRNYRRPGWTAHDSRMRSAYRRRSLARRRRGRR